MEDQEVRLRELQEEYSNLKSLIETAGWRMIVEYAEGQIHNRLPNVLTPLNNLLELGKQEFEKGEISGIKLFQSIPEIVIEDLEEAITLIEKELGHARAERTTDEREFDGSDDEGEFEPPVGN